MFKAAYIVERSNVLNNYSIEVSVPNMMLFGSFNAMFQSCKPPMQFKVSRRYSADSIACSCVSCGQGAPRAQNCRLSGAVLCDANDMIVLGGLSIERQSPSLLVSVVNIKGHMGKLQHPVEVCLYPVLEPTLRGS